ncbi:MAG: VOC family protein [Pseudohongiella sp.]|uniref:VOC family protein n=1 Tax=Pseudohongiella sp. TaxID=1979412 RepID=UPI0034A02916
MPLTAFETNDIQTDYKRLKGKNVVFTMTPTQAGEVTIAIFSDTCGNLIQLYQV